MSKLGDRIKELRKAMRLSQAELADRVGVSRSAIGMYEMGRREPDAESLEALADFFNVDMDYLIGRSDVTSTIITPKYYEHPETTKLAQLAHDNPDVSLMLDSLPDLDPRDLKVLTDMVAAFTRRDDGHGD